MKQLEDIEPAENSQSTVNTYGGSSLILILTAADVGLIEHSFPNHGAVGIDHMRVFTTSDQLPRSYVQ